MAGSPSFSRRSFTVSSSSPLHPLTTPTVHELLFTHFTRDRRLLSFSTKNPKPNGSPRPSQKKSHPPLHQTAIPVLRHRSSAAETITHILHGRHPTKPDMAAYSDHPSHCGVVKDYVLPICADITAVDWVSVSPPKIVDPGSAARLTLVKVKEEARESGKGEILEVMKGVKESLRSEVSAEDVRYGLNFSPGRSNGYEVGMLAMFPGVEELDGLDKFGDELEKHKENVRPQLENIIVLDFVVLAFVNL